MGEWVFDTVVFKALKLVRLQKWKANCDLSWPTEEWRSFSQQCQPFNLSHTPFHLQTALFLCKMSLSNYLSKPLPRNLTFSVFCNLILLTLTLPSQSISLGRVTNSKHLKHKFFSFLTLKRPFIHQELLCGGGDAEISSGLALKSFFQEDGGNGLVASFVFHRLSPCLQTRFLSHFYCIRRDERWLGTNVRG